MDYCAWWTLYGTRSGDNSWRYMYSSYISFISNLLYCLMESLWAVMLLSVLGYSSREVTWIERIYTMHRRQMGWIHFWIAPVWCHREIPMLEFWSDQWICTIFRFYFWSYVIDESPSEWEKWLKLKVRKMKSYTQRQCTKMKAIFPIQNMGGKVSFTWNTVWGCQSENVHLLDDNVYVMLFLSLWLSAHYTRRSSWTIVPGGPSMALGLAITHDYTCTLRTFHSFPICPIVSWSHCELLCCPLF